MFSVALLSLIHAPIVIPKNYETQKLVSFYKSISAGADGGPRSRVCARFTLRSNLNFLWL